MSEYAETIGDSYVLDDEITEALVFAYSTYIGSSGKTTIKYLLGNQTLADLKLRREPNGEEVLGSIEDLNLKVRIQKGDLIEVACSCDSEYMLEVMKKLGKAIRDAFEWIPRSRVCYLFMDNAGGHGSIDAVRQYTQYLKVAWNIEIVHQIPRSPYTNLLDLGVWCSLQSRVEKEHFLKRTDVPSLVTSVEAAWNNGALDDVIAGRVWGRLRNVLVLIKEASGKNDLVEKKRGKKFRNLDFPIQNVTNTNSATETAVATNDDATNGTWMNSLDLDPDDEDDEVELIDI